MTTPQQLRDLWDHNPDALAKAYTDMLKDFGYSSLEQSEVKEKLQRLYAGGSPTDVIDMFLVDWMEKGIESHD